MTQHNVLQLSTEQDRNAHAGERNEDGVEKSGGGTEHGFEHASNGPSRMEVDCHSGHYVLTVRSSEYGGDLRDERCQAAK